MDARSLSDAVRETAFAIHVYLGPGHLERVYENALVSRLRKAGHRIRQQSPIQVFDEDGTLLGCYFADLLVDEDFLIEIKAARSLGPEHEAQILGYLRASGIKHGLLINFGSFRFQIRKYVGGAITEANAGLAK
jgi:GxxExxY protein